MAEEEQQAERQEQATAKRREDFRKRGQVAQSKEVHTAALLTASLILWFFYAPHFWRNLESLSRNFFSLEYLDFSAPAVYVLLKTVLFGLLKILSPVLAIVFVVGFLSSAMQVGFLVSWEPMKPDLGKFNPIKGAAKFVSKRSMVELAKSLAKVLLVGAVAYKTINNELDFSVLLIDQEVAETLSFLGDLSFKVLFKATGIITILALLDYGYTRWELEQKMKMTKQEQKEEFKETEGDPHLKSKIRAIQQEMASKRMMADVPKADVIITNPTHLSIAIRYDGLTMNAPEILAKGGDQVALKIREIAKDHRIPIVENKPVARALYEFKIGATIPEELFKSVAEILAYVYELKKK